MQNQKHSESELNSRACAVLRALIREYVRCDKPVGSRRLAKLHGEGLSPATIRNVMADLEQVGLLTQPHTSAGRVPTPNGYRFYVDSLLETRDLASREAVRIKLSLEEEQDPGELMSKTSKVLSAFSSNVGFVWAPPVELATMKHIEFVRISKQRILVVLVTAAGSVQHRFIRLDQDLNQTELDQAGRYLVTHFEGKTLREIRDDLLVLMAEEKSLYDRMLRNAILLGSAGLATSASGGDDEPAMYLEGAAQIIRKPELADVNRMAALFHTFEKKGRLVRILTECLKSNPSGPTVTIGLEEHLPGMGDWTLISSPYVYEDTVTGSLGILGPCRMEYEKAISLVDYVAKLFGKLLSTN